MSKKREKKEQVVSELSDKVGRAKGLVFTNYQGLTHKQLEELKKALKGVDAELVVTKNTLLKRSLEMSNVKCQMSNLDGPTATLFSYSDPLTSLKELGKRIRLLKLPTIKFGIIDGKLLAENDLIRLSTLPSREILLGLLVGSMKAPIYGLHRALSWNLQKLVLTLKSIENSKQN